MFKLIRIVFLLIVLASVWTTYQIQKNITQDWSGTLDVRIIPILADTKSETSDFVAKLSDNDFREINKYLRQNAAKFGVNLRSGIRLKLAEPIEAMPPEIPERGASRLSIIMWSLRLRWWAWQNQPSDYSSSQIRLYVMYQNPNSDAAMPHSTGLRNGLIGLINARGKRQFKRFHNVVITHELLHIFGATDKYDLISGQPIYPQGYAKPDATPRLPQEHAEIMARAIPLSNSEFQVVTRLSKTRVGRSTAEEIAWAQARPD